MIFTLCGTVSAVDSTNYVSISSNGTQSDGYSGEPSISADGRYVAFNSYADNLVLDDNNGFIDIFVYDRLLGSTIRISTSSTNEEANGNSFEASISSDGCYVAFTSYATNLTLDTNNFADIFIHNMVSGTTERISVSNTGEETNSNSFQPSVSGDGRFIAFGSNADNLVANDTNGCSDIFVNDRVLSTITRVSISNDGEEGNFTSLQPSISGDGNCIAFTSYADNLSPGDGNFSSDIFVYKQTTFSIERISILSTGEEINKNSYDPSISANGQYVVFMVGDVQQCGALINSASNNFSFDDLDGIILIHDILLGINNLVSISNEGEIANDYCDEPAINADGSYVAFSSNANNLVINDNNGCTDVFVHIKETNQTSFFGSITPKIVKSGNTLTIKAYSNNTTKITALILNEILNLTEQADGTWLLNYVVPNISSGTYDVLLTATYFSGNSENLLLDFIVDNTLPTVSGYLTPEKTKSGDLIIINASSGPDTISIWVSICGEDIKMDINGDNAWILYYYIPNKPDGDYPILLTATDKAGNQATLLLNLTLDNTPPLVTASIFPYTVGSSDELTITALSDPDTASITALILNRNYDLVKQVDGSWVLNYTVPNVLDGVYDILLTATDSVGNQGTVYPLSFKVYNMVDNVSPTVSAVVTPNLYQLINGIFPKDTTIAIKALSDSDTVSISALILNREFDMIQQPDGTWILNYSVFGLTEDEYSVVLTAKDLSGNTGTTSTNFTIVNIRPAISTDISPDKVKSGDKVTIIVSSNPGAGNMIL